MLTFVCDQGPGREEGVKCNGCGCGEQPITSGKDSPWLLSCAREGAAADMILFKDC
jgi:hypothetical protein